MITRFTKKKPVCVASADVVPKCRYNDMPKNKKNVVTAKDVVTTKMT